MRCARREYIAFHGLVKQLDQDAGGSYLSEMANTVVNVGEAKTQFSRLLAMAEAGQTVIVARDGVPVVQLTPVNPAKRRFGFRRLSVDDSVFFDPLPDEELARWEGREA